MNSQVADRDSGRLFLGCPVWACPAWVGPFFTPDAKPRDFLKQYSSVFNTVEGNSTFYALPSRDTVRRWANETAPGFRFSLKFPRMISHDKQLVAAEAETATFLDLLSILNDADRLGPTFLQLGPTFDRRQFESLRRYLEALPRELPFAVEVRHRDYFDNGPIERSLDELLRRLHIDRVLFDSRALFSAPPTTEAEIEAQRRKPRPPLRRTVTGRHPLLRLIGRDNLDLVQPWIDDWAPIVAEWLRVGLSPFVFTHTPNDFFAAEFAQRFHRRLSELVPTLPPLPKMPAELNCQKQPKQRQLF
ncbi:MAG: DUF72 domain-containing protein [Planctomycetaceae bacterium]|nr:DUF72 domain-containing protein [Planctomycetaceae bacterium]